MQNRIARVLEIAPARTVGECPVWDAGTERLWWVDINRPALHRSVPATGETETWEMPESIGSFALCRSGALLVALRSGVYRFDPRDRALDRYAAPEPDRPENRLNDGKASPEGRFVVGSMDDRPEKEAIAGLYAISPGGGVSRLASGLTVSNGLAWSPDGRTLWHSDSRQEKIWCWDYDPVTGEVAHQRLVASPDTPTGRPDGAATDAEGGYWSAGVSAGVLNRWLPDGTLDRVVTLPVSSPTMPCFGGPGLRTLYVTSLRRPDDPPVEGSILELDVGVAGAPVGRFAD
ncbi:SMP-30/gluconolactonase/LRE family protein [Roseomonas sp. OT10]|uniref:SMP-30/gluconolactonase/LRE family protein n=1 Tax=Roseomonas cutis TaxID=2897332 RepID=UPI001E29A4F9|nr:SMP-30/gluconolactonase/LRE family protein [Roseomonas sp. OT10]UFN48011.1 SMP-30/gluconolactonase/LRE family protein [Roseomonas sp. OT10]